MREFERLLDAREEGREEKQITQQAGGDLPACLCTCKKRKHLYTIKSGKESNRRAPE